MRSLRAAQRRGHIGDKLGLDCQHLSNSEKLAWVSTETWEDHDCPHRSGGSRNSYSGRLT